MQFDHNNTFQTLLVFIKKLSVYPRLVCRGVSPATAYRLSKAFLNLFLVTLPYMEYGPVHLEEVL